MGEGVGVDVARTSQARGVSITRQAWAAVALEAAGRCTRERAGKLGAGMTHSRAIRESTILEAVLRYVRIHPKVAWVRRMNTGAVQMRGVRFMRFGFLGCSDLIGQVKGGRFLAIEIKAPAGRLTVEQTEFLDRVKRHGGVSGVARSIEDAEKILAEA